MTIGPAPMIRIDLMSVRFGIAASIRHKKRARFCASFAPATGSAPREGCLDQNQAPANPGMPRKPSCHRPFCKDPAFRPDCAGLDDPPSKRLVMQSRATKFRI